VDLRIDFFDGKAIFTENHTMYLHSYDDIVRFCGDDFEIVDVKPTKRWQTFYKCRKK
jgi:hypothetical protein